MVDIDKLNDSEKLVLENAIQGISTELKNGDILRSEILEKIIRTDDAQSPSGYFIKKLCVRGGSIIGDLRLNDLEISYDFCLTEITFQGNLQIINSNTSNIDLSGSRLKNLNFSGLTIKNGQMKIDGLNVAEKVSLSDVEINIKNEFKTCLSSIGLFANQVLIRGLRAKGDVTFRDSNFEDKFLIEAGIFDSDNNNPILINNNFHNNLDFSGVESRKLLTIKDSIIHKTLRLNNSNISNLNLILISVDAIVLKQSTFNILNIVDTKICRSIPSDLKSSAIQANNIKVHGAINLLGCTIIGTVQINASDIEYFYIGGESVFSLDGDGNERINFTKTQITSIGHSESSTYQFANLNYFKAIDLSFSVIKFLSFDQSRCFKTLGIVDLTNTIVNTFQDFKESWPENIELGDFLILNGFKYEYLMNPSGVQTQTKEITKNREDWLKKQNPIDLEEQFKPQPWKQLSQILKSQGFDDDARFISIRRRVKKEAHQKPFITKFLGRFLHLVADYGFNPWKTVIWSFFLVFAFGFYFHHLGQDSFMRIVSGDFVVGLYKDMPQKELLDFYPIFDAFLFSLDTFIPILDLGSESFWRASSKAGPYLQWIIVFEQILGGIFISLIVTGFTGMLSKEDS